METSLLKVVRRHREEATIYSLTGMFRDTLFDAIEDFCREHEYMLERWCRFIRKEIKKMKSQRATVPSVMGAALWFANRLADLGVLFGLAPNRPDIHEIPEDLNEQLVKRCLMLCAACLSLQYLPRH